MTWPGSMEVTRVIGTKTAGAAAPRRRDRSRAGGGCRGAGWRRRRGPCRPGRREDRTPRGRRAAPRRPAPCRSHAQITGVPRSVPLHTQRSWGNLGDTPPRNPLRGDQPMIVADGAGLSWDVASPERPAARDSEDDRDHHQPHQWCWRHFRHRRRGDVGEGRQVEYHLRQVEEHAELAQQEEDRECRPGRSDSDRGGGPTSAIAIPATRRALGTRTTAAEVKRAISA